MTAKMI